VGRGVGWASVVRISSGDVRGKLRRTGELLAKTVLFEKNMRILLTLKNRAVYLSVIFFWGSFCTSGEGLGKLVLR